MSFKYHQKSLKMLNEKLFKESLKCYKKPKILFFQILILTSTFMIQNPVYCETIHPTETFARGAKAWVNNCERYHNLRPASEFSPEQWKTILMHMRIQAGLTGEEERDIYAFLSNSQDIETSTLDKNGINSKNKRKKSSTATKKEDTPPSHIDSRTDENSNNIETQF